LTGTTNPAASTQKLNCHITEQVETSPYTTARLNLPETFANGRTYNVQFGRMLNFSTTGSQTVSLRIPAGMYSSVGLDALVSGLVANATFTVDVGNDGSNEWSGTVGNKSTNTSSELATAFTAYWRAQGSPTTGTIDVPLKVSLSGAGLVLLTNLQVQTPGSRVRYVQLPVQTYSTFNLDFTLGGTGAVALDVGDNGSIDWSADANSVRQLTGNLAAALNAYLAGKSGLVNVPLRFYVSPDRSVTLNDYKGQYSQSSALSATGLQVSSGAQAAGAQAITIREGDSVPLQATIRNSSGADSGLLTAAFFAYAPGWGDWYIGSDFVENLPTNGSAQLNINWDTTGFSGDVPVKVVVNPYGRLNESNYQDNVNQLIVAITPIIKEQTISFTNPGSQRLSDTSIVLSATASSGLTVSFASLTTAICTVSGNKVTFVTAGICTIRASQGGDNQYKIAPDVEQSFFVIPEAPDQFIKFDQLANKTIGDPPFDLSAITTSGLPVSFTSLTIAVCTVTGDKVTLLRAGKCQIQATQNGNTEYNPAPPVNQDFTVLKRAQTITFTDLLAKTMGDSPFTVTATASSDLAVSFSSLTPTICTVDGAVVTLLQTGVCTIRAEQSGNDTYNPAPLVERSFAIQPPNNVIQFGPLSDKMLGAPPFLITATASSGLQVLFTSLTTEVCTVSGELVTLQTDGLCTIRASQPGNDVYPAADP
ncbi:MAG: hypothetical protein KDE47_30075, partial [Caldilineaceae bacterium]|nr:hypothetical protein [Caldilineaceae bacterium]